MATDLHLRRADGIAEGNCVICREPWPCEVLRLRDLIDNLRAWVKLVYPDEMTPHAKRLFDHILEQHGFDGRNDA
jgi:hypothetical protein